VCQSKIADSQIDPQNSARLHIAQLCLETILKVVFVPVLRVRISKLLYLIKKYFFRCFFLPFLTVITYNPGSGSGFFMYKSMYLRKVVSPQITIRIGSAKCYICGRTKNITNYSSPPICDFRNLFAYRPPLEIWQLLLSTNRTLKDTNAVEKKQQKKNWKLGKGDQGHKWKRTL
jgi:hypothetical protein